MPIMPDGNFMDIAEVKGNLRFCESVARFMKRNSIATPYVKRRIEELDSEASMLRRVLTEYERKINETA